MAGTTGSTLRKDYTDLDYAIIDSGIYGKPSGTSATQQAIWRPSPDFLTIGMFYTEGTVDYIEFGSDAEFKIPADNSGSITNPAVMQFLQIGTGSIVETIQDVITDIDTALPTSGAVIDYVTGLGYVYKTGSPDVDYIAVFSDTDTITGTSGFTYNGTNFIVTGDIKTDTALILDNTSSFNVIESTHNSIDIIQIGDVGLTDKWLGMATTRGVWINTPFAGENPGQGDLTIYGLSGQAAMLTIGSEHTQDQTIEFYDQANSTSFTIGQNATTHKFEMDFGSGLDQTTILAIDSGGVLTIADAYSLPSADGTADYVLATNGSGTVTWQSLSGLGGGGTVTSVGLVMPTSEFGVSNSPITDSGNITVTWDTQTATYIFAAPAAADGTPSFRALNVLDLPSHIHSISDITNLQDELDDKADISGTQAQYNIGVWSSPTAIGGESDLTWDGTNLQLNTISDSAIIFGDINASPETATHITYDQSASTLYVHYDGGITTGNQLFRLASHTIALGLILDPGDKAQYTYLGLTSGASSGTAAFYVAGSPVMSLNASSSGYSISLGTTASTSLIINELSSVLVFYVAGAIEAYIGSTGLKLKIGATVNTIEATLTDTDTALPTSGAVVDYVTGLGYGNVYKTGTPANNQIAVWTDDETIEGSSELTWNEAQLIIVDAAAYPLFLRRSTSTVNSEVTLSFDMQNGITSYKSYGSIAAEIVDNTAASEDGNLIFRVFDDGSNTIIGEWNGTAFQLEDGFKFGSAGQRVDEISIDDTFASAANDQLASALAIKTYVDNQIGTEDFWKRSNPVVSFENDADTLRLQYDGSRYTDLSTTSNNSFNIKANSGVTYFNTASINNYLLVFDYDSGPDYYSWFSGDLFKIFNAGNNTVYLDKAITNQFLNGLRLGTMLSSSYMLEVNGTTKLDDAVGIGTTAAATALLDVHGGVSVEALHVYGLYTRFKTYTGEERFLFQHGNDSNAASMSMYEANGTTVGIKLSLSATSYIDGSFGLTNYATINVNTIQDSITDIDTAIPTSGAVVDYVSQSSLGWVNTFGTPANNHVAVFTDTNTIEGDENLTWTAAVFNISSTTDQLLTLQQLGLTSTPGTPVAGNNQIAFLDTDGDVQGYIGINSSGNFIINNSISGGYVNTGDLVVSGDTIMLGTLQFTTGEDVNKIEAALTNTTTYLPTSAAVYAAIQTVTLGSPVVPTGLSLTETGDYVQVSFTSDDDNDSYEIWASQISSSSNFDLVAVIKDDDFQGSPTVTIADNTYTNKAQIWYRIYGIRYGVYSSALTGTTTPSNDVSGVSGVTTSSYPDSIALFWVNPADRRLDEIQVKVDAQAVEANLDEGNSTLCYTGLDENFTYKIPTADLTKYHEFWIYTITKT